MSNFIVVDSTEVRGSKFMVSKEAFDLESFLETYRDDLRITTYSVFNYLKDIISKYGPENVNINPQQIVIQNDDVEDRYYLGFDGNRYDFKFGV